MKRERLYYTVYLNKTDEIVASGNAEECAKQLSKKSLASFYSLVSKNRVGVQKRYTVVTEPIEFDESES